MTQAIRPTQDNVVIRLHPGDAMTRGGLHVPDQARDAKPNRTRLATVLAVGPGRYVDRRQRLGTGTDYTERTAHFIPTQVKVGETVIVDAMAGQDYAFDLSIPRHNKGAELLAYGDERGEFRIVREDEIHGVVEPDDVPEAAE